MLAEALAVVLALPAPPPLTCAGRTDAGVHALGQVVHLDVPAGALSAWRQRRGGDRPPGSGEADRPGHAQLPGLARALTRRAGPAVAVWAAGVAPAGFDARRSATSRRYRYDVQPGACPDPLRAALAWQVDNPLELAAMRLGCDPLVGEHDFAAFCRRPPDRPEGPILRRVLEAGWRQLDGPGLDGSLLRFEIEALSFCHQMVRSVVGLLVAIGEGRARPSDVADRLASGSRSGNPTIAPAHGLCLVRVRYPPPEPFGPGGAALPGAGAPLPGAGAPLPEGAGAPLPEGAGAD